MKKIKRSTVNQEKSVAGITRTTRVIILVHRIGFCIVSHFLFVSRFYSKKMLYHRNEGGGGQEGDVSGMSSHEGIQRLFRKKKGP